MKCQCSPRGARASRPTKFSQSLSRRDGENEENEVESLPSGWDNPTMTLTADAKGRITCRELFPPETSFSAEKDEFGRVILTRLAKEERPPKLVKPIFHKGFWVLPGEVDVEKLAQEIKEERQRRDENILG